MTEARGSRQRAAASTAAHRPASAMERIERAMRMVTVPFPHLAGLVAMAKVTLDERVPTMGVFASGRLVANPAFVGRLDESELVFVLAHEMLHLALRTHDRARGADRLEFNYAHDYIINDMLRSELGRPIPAGGLDMQGARQRSAEEIVLDMRRDAGAWGKTRVWEGEALPARARPWSGAGGRGRLTPGASPSGAQSAGQGGAGAAMDDDAGDVLDAAQERRMYPDAAGGQAERVEAVKAAAARALALGAAIGRSRGVRGIDPGSSARTVDALRGIYKVPWQLALQRWLESVAPGERSFTRPSRRGADREDIALPGRRREGWILNLVLDTSGSMAEELPRALGTVAEFCDALGVDRVRLVQCDANVTGDELLAPEDITRHEMVGYGGSDLSPALHHLAADRDVRAVIALTDGEIGYPPQSPPFDLLWLLPPGTAPGFDPPYGRSLRMEPR